MAELIDNPEVVAKLAAQVMAGQPTEAKEVKTEFPPSGDVILPAGLITANGSLVKTAVVRELNGQDEEEIAKFNNSGKALTTILKRGLVSLGGNPVSDLDLDSLLIGDRDALLLAIYKVTFGNKAHYETLCSACGAFSVAEVDLDTDVPVKTLDNPNDRSFTVTTKQGPAVVALPNGVTQRRLLEAETQSSAESITLILSGCLLSLNGNPTMGPSTALGLSIPDRAAIISEIYDRSPGPRLGEVTKACEACGETYRAPLSLAALFRV